MRKQTTLATAGGMTVTHDKPYDANGVATDQPSMVTVSPAFGAPNASQLTPAGIVAMTAAANTYVAALSAADRNLLDDTYPGGLTVSISARLVQIPALASGVAGLASALGAVVAVGANREVIPGS